MGWDTPNDQDLVCVWCGGLIVGEGRHTTLHHGGPYHVACLPSFPEDVYERITRSVLAGSR